MRLECLENTNVENLLEVLIFVNYCLCPEQVSTPLSKDASQNLGGRL